MKDDEVTSALANLFSVLKELKWRPDSKSVLAMSLAGTGIGKKGARFFRKVGSSIIMVTLYSPCVYSKRRKLNPGCALQQSLQGRQQSKRKAEEDP